MDSFVHRRLTRRWALAEGFSAEDAETLAQLTDRVDVRRGDLPRPWNWSRHYGRYGAWRLAGDRLERACATAGEPTALGDLAVALHAVQDGVGHGGYGPLTHPLYRDMDSWEARDDETRAEIERLSRQALATYHAALRLAEERAEARSASGVGT
jgi:hypothetical protein